MSSATQAALSATYLPKWHANTSYTSGTFVVNPSGQIVSANSTFTSGTTYSAANWTIVSSGSGLVAKVNGTSVGEVDFVTATASDVPFAPTGTIAATNVQAALAEVASEAVQTSTRGVALGVATLDSSGQVPLSQLGNAPTNGGSAVSPGNPSPAMHSLLAWSVDPALTSGLLGLTLGQVFLFRTAWPQTATITNIITDIATAGAGLVSCYAGVYDANGNRLGMTADQSTAWTSTGLKLMPLTSPITSLGGSATTYIYIALLVGTGSTTFANMFRRVASAASGIMNLGLTPATARAAQAGSSLTALPATITMSSNTLSTAMIPIGLS